MPALHIIDAARIAHEIRRSFFRESKDRDVTAAWGDLPEDRRRAAVDATQNIIDGGPPDSGTDENRLRFATIEALRPFVTA